MSDVEIFRSGTTSVAHGDPPRCSTIGVGTRAIGNLIIARNIPGDNLPIAWAMTDEQDTDRVLDLAQKMCEGGLSIVLQMRQEQLGDRLSDILREMAQLIQDFNALYVEHQKLREELAGLKEARHAL